MDWSTVGTGKASFSNMIGSRVVAWLHSMNSGRKLTRHRMSSRKAQPSAILAHPASSLPLQSPTLNSRKQYLIGYKMINS